MPHKFYRNSPFAAAPVRTTPEAISNRQRWGIVWLLFVASFINYLDRGTISAAIPLIAHDLGLGPEVKGILLSAFFWSYAAMQIPIGWAADRANLRWLYAAAFALWSLSQGLTGLAAGLGMLLFFRMLLGVGESIYLPAGTKIVSALFESKDRGFPSGLFDCGTRAGLAVGVPLTALLIVHYGWRKMFVIVGLTALLWLIPWLIVFPSKLPERKETEPGSASAAHARRFAAVTWNHNLLGLCLGFFCFGYYWYLFVTWVPDYLITVRHLSIMKAGIYAALPYIVFGASQPISGWLTDKLVRRGWDETRTRKGMVTLAFLTGLMLIGATRASTAIQAIWLMAGASLVGFAAPNLMVILQCCAPEREVGIWTGFENFAGNLGGVLAPMATGFLIGRTGSYSPGFLIAAAVLLAGLLAYWFVVGKLGDDSP